MTSLTDSEINEAAQSLLDARARRSKLDDLVPTPASAAEGYAIQDATIELNEASVVGWKVGATSPFALKLFNTDEPFAGPIFEGTIFHGTADASGFMGPSVEGEIAFVLSDDLPVRDDEYSRDEIVAAIGEAYGAMELVESRIEGFPPTLGNMIADCSGNGGLLLGAPSGDWPNIDLLATTASMTIGDEVVGSGLGADAYGDPVESLRWLANHLSGRGHGLSAGMFVTTGSCTGIAPLPSGGVAVADFGSLGQVTANG
ncbi:MAG: 2-keto-4-pentenoate hydratase [Candidatus Poriferisodalaceae bacterium]|jgi:2-keto-4-pentenoate hydratase